MIPLYLLGLGFGGGVYMSYGVAWDKQRAVDLGALIVIVGTLGSLGFALFSRTWTFC